MQPQFVIYAELEVPVGHEPIVTSFLWIHDAESGYKRAYKDAALFDLKIKNVWHIPYE